MLKFIFTALFSLALLLPMQAQELQCDVIVNTDRLATTDRQIVQAMQTSIYEFMNNRSWSGENYKIDERIKCKLFITLESPSVGNYTANVRVISSRPVYGTDYETTLLSFTDKAWAFEFTQSMPLQFSENSFTSNLASLLSFYAYIIIGMDNDSFAKMGGSQMYDRAQNVMNNVLAQSNNNPGWKAFDDTRNRYWLLTNLQDPQMAPFREGLYLYHRHGLDIMATKPEEARKTMVGVMKAIQKVNQIRPGAALIRSFFEAKSTELVNVFKGAEQGDKSAVLSILQEVDPTNSGKYQAITQR